MLQDIRNADGLVGVRFDKLQRLIDVGRISFGVLLFRDALGKVHDGGIAQLIDRAHRRAAFALLGIEVDELIGLFDIEVAADGAHFSDHADKPDEDIFCLPQCVVGDFPLRHGRAARHRIEKGVYPGDVSRRDIREKLLFKAVSPVREVGLHQDLFGMLFADLVLKARKGVFEVFRDGNILPVKEIIEKGDEIEKPVEGVARQSEKELLQRFPFLPRKRVVVQEPVEQGFVGLLVEEGSRDEEQFIFPDVHGAVKPRIAADERNVLVVRRPACHSGKDGRIARTRTVSMKKRQVFLKARNGQFVRRVQEFQSAQDGLSCHIFSSVDNFTIFRSIMQYSHDKLL